MSSSDLNWREIAAEVLAEYGVSGRLSPLPGENRNFLVEQPGGGLFVLKICPGKEPGSGLEGAVVERLYHADAGLELPRSVPTLAGSHEVGVITDRARDATESAWAQLLAFVQGEPWGAAPRDPRLRRELGERLGRMNVELEGFEHPGARRTHRWDLARAGQHRVRMALVPPGARRDWLEILFHRWAAGAAPRLGELPHSVIHGDANDENILVRDGSVAGLIDFGDTLWNPVVCELAIALAYVLLREPDPLRAGADVVAGYHSVRPLSSVELDVLFPLVCGRLAVTVTTAAERRGIDPNHPTWFATEAAAWKLIERLAAVEPAGAARTLGAGTGLRDVGPSGVNLLERRRERIGPSLSLAYDEPLEIVRGAGQYLFDRRGRPFLDMVNNVCHVGHCHPHVVAAGQRQMAQLNTNTRYLYDGLTAYAERLTALLPSELSVCYFVNSGSEANELALRLVRAHTKSRDLLVVDGAYHGHTSTLIDISPYKFMGRGGSGRAEDWVHIVPMPDGYRGPHKGSGRATGAAYADAVRERIAAAERPIGGYIAESILSCGGQVMAPDGYFEDVYGHVRAAGGVCVADEVQVGFGRVGSHFWGFELGGVVPDVVVLGKPIGNGHPMAAVVTTPQIAASFDNGMEFFCTFGGNPVSCAIGSAVLDVIEDEGLQERARVVGGRLRAGLVKLAERHELIGDVRGTGLFLGIELVRDRTTLEPAAAEATRLVERMKARGVLLSTDGPLHNTIKIKPPMVLNEDDVDMLLRGLDAELTRGLA